MDIKLKHRLVGACVILALAVFFLPMILDSEKYNQEIDSEIPEESVLKQQSADNSVDGPATDSGSLTINLNEDEPEKAIIKPVNEEKANPPQDSELINQSDTSAVNDNSDESQSQQDSGAKQSASDTVETSKESEPQKTESQVTVSQETGADAEGQSTDTVKDKTPAQDDNTSSSEQVQEVSKDTTQADSERPEFKDNSWVIQIGSFSNKENATKLVSDLRTKGYRAYLREAGEYSRVFVGPYPDKQEASSRTESLEKVVGAAVKVIEFDPESH